MQVLNRLLEISIYAAVIFLAIMAVKMAFSKKISPGLHFLIWFLLIARLCLPVTIDSGFKLFVIPATDSASVQEEATASAQDVPAAYAFKTQPDSGTQYFIQPQPKTADINLQTPGNTSPNFQPTVLIKWTDIFIAVWLTGLFVSALWLVVTFAKMNRLLKRHGMKPPARILEILVVCKKEWGICKPIPVYLMPHISTPALVVGFRPKLILPADIAETLSDRQIEFALKHELTHYNRKDHITGLLIRILQAVYWFNPFVWLTGRFMIADMETACDSMVMKTLGKQEKKQYVLTLLQMFSSKKAPQFLIGMALSHTEKIAEKRIRGAYMNSKSKRSAKMIAGVMTVILLAGCFTTACQPTPDKPIVVNKANGLENLIEATPSASSDVSPSNTTLINNDALYEKLAAPKHWTFEEAALDGKLNLTADVDIELPNVTQLPAATAKSRAFTQEDLDNVAEIFGVKGATWTTINHTMTKEQIQQEMIDHEARRAAYEAQGDTQMVKKMDEDLKDYEQMYIDAPEEIELKNIELNIDTLSEGEELNGDTMTLIGFEGTTEVNGQSVYFMANNGYAGDFVDRIFVNYGSDPMRYGGTYVDEPYGITLTKEQAGKKANEIARQLTDDLSLCYVFPAATLSERTKWAWACVFMREINGCPTAYESTDIGSDMNTTVSEPVPYEKMVIVMDDAGMASLEWKTPMTVESIDNTDVSVLPFDEIFDRAKDHIVQRWAYEAVGRKDNEGNDVSDPGCTVKISKVNLGLMRVAKANSDDYYYIPVWNFFSDLEHTPGYYERMGFQPFTQEMAVDENGNLHSGVSDGDPYAWGAITVNALDGSIIDRNLGY